MYDFHRLLHQFFFNLNINLIILFHHVITAFIFICFFYLFIYLFLVLSLFVQFEPNLRDKRLKVNGIGSPALGRLSSLGRGGRGSVVLNECLYKGALFRVRTPYPFMYHFSRKKYPFRIPSIDKW